MPEEQLVSKSGKLSVNKSVFLSNSAGTYGGAIYHYVGWPENNYVWDLEKNDSFLSENCTYTNNEAVYGGALYLASQISISTKHNIFQGNSAIYYGGAVFILHGYQGISEADSFITNTCLQFGGAAALWNTQVFNITKGFFQDNRAEEGAGIYTYLPKNHHQEVSALEISIKNTNFTKNQHTKESAGTVHIAANTVLQINGEVIFSKNQGALYTSNSQITFRGDILLQNNTASQQGGAITCVQSTLTFEEESTTKIISNRADYGGGMSLYQCTVSMMGDMVIDSNWAGFSGGGIYSYQSTIKQGGDFAFNRIDIINNIAHQNGGGVSLIASQLIITHRKVYFINNTASQNGGGMYLETSSITLKDIHDMIGLYKDFKLEFTNNTAMQKEVPFIYLTQKSSVIKPHRKTSTSEGVSYKY